MTTILLSPTELGSSLAGEIARFDARVVAWPELNLDVEANYSSLDEAITNLFGYDWVVFKNGMAATSFLLRFQRNHEPDELDDLKTLAVGDAAGDTLGRSSIHVDMTLDRLSLKDRFTAIESYAGSRDSLSGLNFLVPSAGITREAFEEQLEDAGARVDSVIAYRTTHDTRKLTQIRALFIGGAINCVAFSETAGPDQLAQLFDTDDLPRLLCGARAVCLNQETSDAAKAFGLNTIMPGEPTVAALAQLIIEGTNE